VGVTENPPTHRWRGGGEEATVAKKERLSLKKFKKLNPRHFFKPAIFAGTLDPRGKDRGSRGTKQRAIDPKKEPAPHRGPGELGVGTLPGPVSAHSMVVLPEPLILFGTINFCLVSKIIEKMWAIKTRVHGLKFAES